MNGTAMFLLLIALGLGAALGYVFSQVSHRADIRAANAEHEGATTAWTSERKSFTDTIARLEQDLGVQMRSAQESRLELAETRRLNQQLEAVMAPMRTSLDELARQVGEAERARTQSQSTLAEQVTRMSRDFGQAAADVRGEARRLSHALSRSERRGAWGEMQLRQLVEGSGMLRHVHFEEQDATRAEEGGTLRPDLVVSLGGGRQAVVDAKVPLDAFLRFDGRADSEAAPEGAGDLAADGDAARAHADAVANHITKLSGKDYWRRYNSPEFVIMFLPAEGLLSAALDTRPDLLQMALDKRVILATPTTLMAMLHAISHAWRQADAAEQAKEIQEAGADLYRRLMRAGRAIHNVGAAISKSTTAYNEMVATMESRVFPAGRRMEALAVAQDPLPAVESVAAPVRELDPAKWINVADPADESVEDPQVRSTEASALLPRSRESA